MKSKRSFVTHLFIGFVVCLIFTATGKAQTAEDFWAMKAGNSWNYSGSNNFGDTWTWRTDVVREDPTVTLPDFTTYYLEGFDNGVTLGEKNWYAINAMEIRQMRLDIFGFDDILGTLRWFPVVVLSGLRMGFNPIIVGASWTDNDVPATFDGTQITVTAQNSVLGQAPVTDGSGRTYTAYQVRRVLTVPQLGGVVEDKTKWFVPYLGVVKQEEVIVDTPGEIIETEVLTSANITLPAGMTFVDVPLDYFAHIFIEQLLSSGITGGCSAVPPPLFCPENNVTRGQMAVFIEAFLGNPANTCSSRFSDVPSGPFCGFIERMADDGITSGCGGGRFCPNDPVTRGQMAVFIEGALGHTPNTCQGSFTDVPIGNPFCGFIERMADDGITSGCGSGRFCPNDPVTRAQMAVFLMAAPPPVIP